MTFCNLFSSLDTDRALADFAEYERWGGARTFESWLDRYKDYYRLPAPVGADQ